MFLFFTILPLWHCGGDRNKPLLSPGSKSHPSVWSRVCLQGRRINKALVRDENKNWQMQTLYWWGNTKRINLMSSGTTTTRWQDMVNLKKRAQESNFDHDQFAFWWWWMKKDKHSTFPPVFFKPAELSLYFQTCLHSYAAVVHHCSLFHQPLQNCSQEPVGNSAALSTSRRKHSTSQLKSSR